MLGVRSLQASLQAVVAYKHKRFESKVDDQPLSISSNVNAFGIAALAAVLSKMHQTG